MVTDFLYGHDVATGWRQLHGPTYLNLPAVVATLGLLDIDPRLGFVGHQPGGFPDWRVFAKPPSRREIRGLLFEDAEYARLDYDPYRAIGEVLGLEFVRLAVETSVPRRHTVATAVPVDDPGYLAFAYGLFLTGNVYARKKTYWSVLPSTGTNRSPLSWFVSRSDGAVSVADWDQLFPAIRDDPATSKEPFPPVDDPMVRVESMIRNALGDLTGRLDGLAARVEELERRPSAEPGRLDRLEEAVDARACELACEIAGLRAEIARLHLALAPTHLGPNLG